MLEITVALAIAGVLASFALSNYRQHAQKVRRAEGRAALLHVLMQQERHFSWQHSYRAFQPGPNETGFKWFSGEQPQHSAYQIAAEACNGEALDNCVHVTATPADTSDRCGVLYADSRGRRGSRGLGDSGNPGSADGCW